MLPYWVLYGSSALAALFGSSEAEKRRSRLGLILLVLVVVAMVGLRYKVGADWDTYLYLYERAGKVPLHKLIGEGDSAFEFLNWLGQQWDLRIWFVNLVCAACFGWGLYRFSLIFDNPYLALAVAIPYIVIAVAMGYTRQGAALGFIMGGLADYIRRENALRLAVFVFLGALFHSSAVVIFPLVALTAKRSRFINLLIVIFATYFAYVTFAEPAVERIRENYLKPAYGSQGAVVRTLMDALAAAVFAISHRSLKMPTIEKKIWRNFSLASVVALIALSVVSSSAVVDRLAVYLLPLQVAVFTRLASVGQRMSSVVVLLVAYGAVLFVWLNFAANSWLWTPYGAFFITN